MSEWRSRIVGYGTEDPEQLLANPANWRIHPEYQQKALAGVLDEVGWVDDIIINQTTGHVLDGHLRVQLSLRKGENEVPVKYVELSEAEEALILATFDPISAAAAADREKLGALLQSVQTGEAGVQALLGELAERELGLFGDGPPSLDELEEEYGEPQERDFWPVVKVQVSPDTFGRYQDYMGQIPDEDEAVKFERLMGAVDASVFGAELP